MRRSCFLVALAALLFAALSTPLVAAITIPGADGSDGALSPTSDLVIDLAQAPTGTWNQPGNGHGVYDANKWAVVFKYSSVSIPTGVTVSFTNHPSGAPVVWLVQGDVDVAGTLSVSSTFTSPGPGGFRSRLGPGAYAGYATEYGNVMVMPLIGGSGGQQGYHGGGAILVAAAGTIRLTRIGGVSGRITAEALGGGSTGGGIRLISDKLEYVYEDKVYSQSTYPGRIRIETNQITPLVVPGSPQASWHIVGTTAQIWPEDTAPRIKSISLAGVGVPGDPRSALVPPDVYFASPATRTLVIQAENVPLDWHVRAHLVLLSGSTSQRIEATRTGGDLASSTWEAQMPLAEGYSAIQVRASVD